MIGNLVRNAIALVVVLATAAMPARAHADARGDAVALLPLDADKNLEIYGQPVASEIARALVAGDIDVVVVGSKMAVPEGARLIVDGTIAGKGGTVVLTVRMRDPTDGTVLRTLSATAASLATIDKAAAELAARVLPAVRDRIAALHEQHEDHGQVTEVRHPRAPAPAPAKPRPILISVSTPASGTFEPLRGALGDAVTGWTRAHDREPVPTDPNRLIKAFAANTVAASGNDLAIAFEIRDYTVTAGEVPLARARVRVRIANASEILFDRVIATDSVVGDRRGAPEVLATRTAREILEILRPHIRRAVPPWR
jgi:hypothetical protein